MSTATAEIAAPVPIVAVPGPRPLHPRERAERCTRWVVAFVVVLVLLYGFH